MANPNKIKEFRYLSGTTFNTDYTAADDAAWAAGTAEKLMITNLDLSGLVHEGLENPEIESSMMAKGAFIPGLRVGSIKVSTYLGAANSDISANPVATLLSKIMGGIANPSSARTDLADVSGTHTTTRVYASGVESNVVAGQAVKIGTRGDGRGDGRVYPITATGTDYIDLGMACPSAPNDGDALTFSTTVYFDDTTTQQYIDTLSIGHASNDQIQTLGGMGGFSISGLKAGEIPQIEFDLMVADWREVSVGGNADQLEPTSATQGNRPPVERGLGAFLIADNGSTTVEAVAIDDLTITPNITYEAIPDPNGVNGIGGFAKVPGMVQASFTTVVGEQSTETIAGLYNDFDSSSPTAKQIMAQFGVSDQRCAAIEIPKYYLDKAPTRADLGQLQGVAIEGHGDVDTTITTALGKSPIRIHYF